MIEIKEVTERVITIFQTILKTEAAIKKKTKLEELFIDSINFVEIVVCLETEFDFEFEDNMLDRKQFTDIESIAKYVASRA